MRKGIIMSTLISATLLINSCASKVVYIESLPKKDDENKIQEKEKSLYQKELEEKIKSLVSSPITPIRTPPTISRILFLPYTSKTGELVMSHYVYFKIDDGKWIFGDYLVDTPIQLNAKKLANPLSTEIELKASQQSPKPLKQESSNNQIQKALENIGITEKKEKGIYEENEEQ